MTDQRRQLLHQLPSLGGFRARHRSRRLDRHLPRRDAGRAAGSPSTAARTTTPVKRPRVIVVDYDDNLADLCARLSAERRKRCSDRVLPARRVGRLARRLYRLGRRSPQRLATRPRPHPRPRGGASPRARPARRRTCASVRLAPAKLHRVPGPAARPAPRPCPTRPGGTGRRPRRTRAGSSRGPAGPAACRTTSSRRSSH